MTLAEVGETAVSLRCVIPEPNLWTPDAPYRYGWSVTAEREGEPLDQRVGGLFLKER
jgi:beta-galactosidase/beta-glucuronidase